MFFDTVKVVYRCKHKPFGTSVEYGRGTDKERLSHKSVSVKGRFKGCRLNVVSARKGELLIVEGSFPRFLQGHNVLGSDDLLRMTYRVFKNVTKILGIKPSNTEIKAVKRGAVEVERLDFTRIALLESAAEVIAALTALRLELPFRTHAFSCYGVETIYVQQRSRKWTLKFYNKAAHLREYPLPKDLPLREKLLELTEKLLRIELTLRQDELRRVGIVNVADVKVGRIDRIFLQRLRDLNLRRVDVLFTEPPGDLSVAAKLVREIYLRGGVMPTYVPPSTASYYSRLLKQRIGLDMRTPKEHADAAEKLIDLREVLSEKLQRGAPKWVRESGLVWSASKNS